MKRKHRAEITFPNGQVFGLTTGESGCAFDAAEGLFLRHSHVPGVVVSVALGTGLRYQAVADPTVLGGLRFDLEGSKGWRAVWRGAVLP